MLCSFLHLGLANWRRFAAIVTVPVTRTVGFAGSAEPSGTQAANTGLCFAAYELQERTLAPRELVTQLRAQVRKASMMWQGSIWTSWQRDLVEIKIFFFFSLQGILNSVSRLWFSLFLFLFRWGNVRAKIIINPLNYFQMHQRAVSWTMECILDRIYTEISQESHQKE